MSIPKQKFREVVLLLLYSDDSAKTDEEEMIPLVMETLSVTKRVVREAHARMRQILEKLPEIDEQIKKISKSYSLERIQRLERNVLRLGAFEILFDDEIPGKVAIAEAMRLGRKFSTKESAQFINAVLDQLYQAKIGGPQDLSKLATSVEELKEYEEAAEEVAKKEPPMSLDS